MRYPSFRIGPLLALSLALGFCPAKGLAATVSGVVSEPPQYLPLQGAWVYLWHAPTKEVDSIQTDSSGEYGFSDVTGCELACYIAVRKPGFWSYTSDNFQLAAEGGKEIDVGLQRVHALTVRAVKAEDTTQAVLNSQAVMFSAENEPPRCLQADSAGRMQFKEMKSFTGYLLSVSAPGRKATSNMLHFHDPVSNGFWRVTLDSDVAETNKAVHGILSAQGAGPVVHEQVVLSCRNDQIAADLFAISGLDGAYSLEGVPADCDSAMLYAGLDSVSIAMPDKENHFDWSAEFPGILAIKPGRAARIGRGSQKVPWHGYDLAGRKLNAGRARFRP